MQQEARGLPAFFYRHLQKSAFEGEKARGISQFYQTIIRAFSNFNHTMKILWGVLRPSCRERKR